MAVELFTDRIIAGSLKGRRLVLPKHEGLRPTKNRVRQAIFNLLGARVNWPGLTVADICCGSGALGLEALSRGAAQVFLADTDTAAAAKNVEALGVGHAVRLFKADARVWAPPVLCDVVLADPPYGSNLTQTLLDRAGALSRPGAWWVLEIGEKDTPCVPECFCDTDLRPYGLAKVWIGRYAG